MITRRRSLGSGVQMRDRQPEPQATIARLDFPPERSGSIDPRPRGPGQRSCRRKSIVFGKTQVDSKQGAEHVCAIELADTAATPQQNFGGDLDGSWFVPA